MISPDQVQAALEICTEIGWDAWTIGQVQEPTFSGQQRLIGLPK